MATRARRRKQVETSDEPAPELPNMNIVKRGRAARKIPDENADEKLNYVSHPSIVNNVESLKGNVHKKIGKGPDAKIDSNAHDTTDKSSCLPIVEKKIESSRLTRSRKHAFVEVTNMDIPVNSIICTESDVSSKKSKNNNIKNKKKPKKKENKTNSTVKTETKCPEPYIKNVEVESLGQNNESSSTASFHSATGSPMDTPAELDLNKSFDSESEPKPIENVSEKMKNNRSKSNKGNRKVTKNEVLETLRNENLNKVELTKQESKVVTRGVHQKITDTSTIDDKEHSEISAFNEENQINKRLSKMDCTFEVANQEVCLENQLSPQTVSKSNKLNTTFELIEPSIVVPKKQKYCKSFNNSDLRISELSKVHSNNSSRNGSNEKSKEQSKLESLYNTSPVLVDSSVDTSVESNAVFSNNCDRQSMLFSSSPKHQPTARLTREGTFTKEEATSLQDASSNTNQTPPSKVLSRTRSSSNISGTPHPGTHKRTKSVSILNLTHSIEKLRTGETNDSTQKEKELRQTKVMFCSPVVNGWKDTRKSNLVKSSLKGSNKTFVFKDTTSSTVKAAARKRSFIHNDVEDLKTKKKKLTADTSIGVGRGVVGACATPPRRSAVAGAGAGAAQGSGAGRCRLPNFAAVHRRAFDRMESLGEAQERRARRAHLLLHPLHPPDSPLPRVAALPGKTQGAVPSQPRSTSKFGYKPANVNPFTLPACKPAEPSQPACKPAEPSQPACKPAEPSQPACKLAELPTKPHKAVSHIPRLAAGLSAGLAAGSAAARRRQAQLAARRQPAGGGVVELRQDARQLIRGVRTNRRFQLQMQMRNLN